MAYLTCGRLQATHSRPLGPLFSRWSGEKRVFLAPSLPSWRCRTAPLSLPCVYRCIATLQRGSAANRLVIGTVHHASQPKRSVVSESATVTAAQCANICTISMGLALSIHGRTLALSAPSKTPRKRAASAPPARPDEPGEPRMGDGSLEGELEPLPNEYVYESADENDGPSHILEGEDLVGLDDRIVSAPRDAAAAALAAPAAPGSPHREGPPAPAAPITLQVVVPSGAGPGQVLQVQTPDGRPLQFVVPPNAVAGTTVTIQLPAQPAPPPAAPPPPPVRNSPLRSQMVPTGAAQETRKLTKAQEEQAVAQAQWTALKTDGTEDRRFERPDFSPYKEGTAPDGFVPTAEHERGGPRPELASLTPKIHPAIYVAECGFDRRMFSQFQAGSNSYAAAHGAGSPDFWKEYRPFGLAEIMAGCGLLLRNGVSPMPQMQLLFENPGQHFIFGDKRVQDAWPGINCGGPARRWTQFRSFFHIQDDSARNWKKADPNTGEFMTLPFGAAGPLSKCEPMLSYARYKWGVSWLPGKRLSLDEETAGFKGRCALVVRIKNKTEGDGFQADAICEGGYTITFWFRCDNLPCPQENDISPRDTRCAWLVDQLPGAWNHLFMDNLFTSWKFGEMLAKRQCLFAGTCTTQEWRGLHRAVVQKEVTTAKAIEEAKGTMRASVRPIAGSPKCEVICCSYYDDKPFHMMGNTSDGVSVIEWHRKCFNTTTQRHFYVIVKRLSLADLYNFWMNSVDIADQLRGYYRPDGLWVKMRKWWWAIFLWCMGQTVVNGYVLYKAVCRRAKAKPMTHLEFHVQVTTAWCKTPQLVLDYKPEPADTAPAPADEGVRGERQAAAAAEKAATAAEKEAAEAEAAAEALGGLSGVAATPIRPGKPALRTPGSSAPRVRSKEAEEAKAAGRTPPPLRAGVGRGIPKMTDAKHTAAEESYVAGLVRHEVDFPTTSDSNCQLCGTGRGMRMPGQRYQTTAQLRCATCGINMCGPGCWKLLHGYYKVGEEPDEKAATFRGPGKKKPAAAAAAAEEEEEE